jgi:hypothetical protein
VQFRDQIRGKYVILSFLDILHEYLTIFDCKIRLLGYICIFVLKHLALLLDLNQSLFSEQKKQQQMLARAVVARRRVAAAAQPPPWPVAATTTRTTRAVSRRKMVSEAAAVAAGFFVVELNGSIVVLCEKCCWSGNM